LQAAEAPEAARAVCRAAETAAAAATAKGRAQAQGDLACAPPFKTARPQGMVPPEPLQPGHTSLFPTTHNPGAPPLKAIPTNSAPACTAQPPPTCPCMYAAARCRVARRGCVTAAAVGGAGQRDAAYRPPNSARATGVEQRWRERRPLRGAASAAGLSRQPTWPCCGLPSRCVNTCTHINVHTYARTHARTHARSQMTAHTHAD